MQETRGKNAIKLNFRNVLLATKFTCHESLYVSELRAQGAHSRASQAGMSICFIEVIGKGFCSFEVASLCSPGH